MRCPDRASWRTLLCAAFLAVSSSVQGGTADLTAGAKPRQPYKGFGFSLINTERYGDLTRAQQLEISKAVVQGTGANLLRLWGSSNWTKDYIQSNLLPDALAAGIDTVLMAPGGDPVAISDEIRKVRDAGFTIHYTGLVNEPDKTQGWDGKTTLRKFAELRSRLEGAGLQTRQICCEDANVDGDAKERIDAILADSGARRALSAVATHSYNMAAESDYARRAFQNSRDWWMTEHSAEGGSHPNDFAKASISANTMLNDLNQGVTHWIYFQGYGRSTKSLPEVHNNVYLAYYDGSSPGKAAGSGWFVFGAQYHYFRQINQAFPYGTVLRRVTATGLPSADMTWTYGTKSPINAAVGKRPDGRIAMAISNANVGGMDEDFTIRLDIEELRGTGTRRFEGVRSGPSKGFLGADSGVVLVDGRGSVRVARRDLLTLVEILSATGEDPEDRRRTSATGGSPEAGFDASGRKVGVGERAEFAPRFGSAP